MGILEEINYLKNQGMDDQEISGQLQEKGATPRAINDAFNQMKIKNAVSAEESGMGPPVMKGPPQASSLYVPKTQEISNGQSENLYAPQPMEEMPSQQYEGAGEYSQEEYYPQAGYGDTGAGGGVYDTDTLIEIAEQVFSEKIKKEQKQIEALNEFATLAETKISNNHERIKRIEAVIDKLQIAILEKIGSYGKNLESIKKEMEMVENSFEKIIPKLHEIHSGHHAEHHSAETGHKKKK